MTVVVHLDWRIDAQFDGDRFLAAIRLGDDQLRIALRSQVCSGNHINELADSNLKCNTCNQVRFADVITSFVLVLSTTSA